MSEINPFRKFELIESSINKVLIIANPLFSMKSNLCNYLNSMKKFKLVSEPNFSFSVVYLKSQIIKIYIFYRCYSTIISWLVSYITLD